LKELRLLREKVEAVEGEKKEQERLAWKFQEEVDALTESLDLEHKALVSHDKLPNNYVFNSMTSKRLQKMRHVASLVLIN